jgi:sulfatase-modifying factor enzyme 1
MRRVLSAGLCLLVPGALLVLYFVLSLPAPPRLARALLASPNTAPLRPRCPAGMVPVRGQFCIDVYEASTELVDAQGKLIGPHTPYAMEKGERVRAVSRAGVHPQGHISFEQAREACTLAGKRLCSDAEWMTACRGPDGNKYPYGREHDPAACNERASSPFWKLLGGRPPDSILSSPVALNNPRLNQQGGLAKTGAFARCVSAYGVFDMVGNLHEWTADPGGTFRGGYYRDAREHGPGCLYVTKGHDTYYRDYSTGFRCCASPR